jgi:hypothetical protein
MFAVAPRVPSRTWTVAVGRKTARGIHVVTSEVGQVIAGLRLQGPPEGAPYLQHGGTTVWYPTE